MEYYTADGIERSTIICVLDIISPNSISKFNASTYWVLDVSAAVSDRRESDKWTIMFYECLLVGTLETLDPGVS